MSKVLVTFREDWCDEFDVCGLKLYDKEGWNDIVTRWKLVKDFSNFSWYFGTNEGFDSEQIDSEWIDIYHAIDITDEQYSFLRSVFTEHWGQFPDPEYIMED